jgi:methyl-accepting chemotaxis protein
MHHLGELVRQVMTAGRSVAIIGVMTRILLLAGVVTGALLLVAGCGGEESELCQSLGDLQESVQSLGDIELAEGAVDELQQSADEINADIEAVQKAAGGELGPELADLKSSAQALATDFDAAAAQAELTREAIGDLAGSVSSVVTAFQALQEAAPDCDL